MDTSKVITVADNGVLIETEQNLQDKHDFVSNISTPKAFVKDKGGFDYVDEAYMRHLLNNHYPIWKWDVVKYEFIGDKVIVIHGRLTIIDNGIERHFDSVAAHRIASNQKGYVDLGNDLKGANTDAFKVAVNRLCNIADDVYRKQIPDLILSEEQKGAINELLVRLDDVTIDKVKEGMKDLSVNSTNYNATIRKLEQMQGDK